ncbi:MAG: DUF933 domain-containing protein [Victivallales bacterium]|nr:DUF933 domain-containing protein [Victivallales bacterium]
MKIGYGGMELPEGKVRYADPILKRLEEKFEPKKVSPYFFEFVLEGYDVADAIAMLRDKLLDLLVLDMEKLERRIERLGGEGGGVGFLRSCLAFMEGDSPLCDMEVSAEEGKILNELAPLSWKPVLVLDDPSPEINKLIEQVMEKAGVMFFYTAGKPEVHAWFIREGSDIVTCAGKIHTDLARGFIKGEIVNIDDYGEAHNLNDARAKGLAKLVDRDYVVRHGDIIEIRFNV